MKTIDYHRKFVNENTKKWNKKILEEVKKMNPVKKLETNSYFQGRANAFDEIIEHIQIFQDNEPCHEYEHLLQAFRKWRSRIPY
jgi:hypothetical protein